MAPRQVRFAGQEITGVAVAIRRQPQGHTHSGVLYRHTNGQLCLLHLRWDFDLAHEVFDGSFAWVVPDLLPEEADEVRAVCRDVMRRMPLIHYSFRFDPEAVLDRETAQLISDVAPYGLTCSTFVLAVFNSASVRLIGLDDWQERADDRAWYGRLLSALSGTADPDHISRIASDVRSLRVRPEEVAAACLAHRNELPVGFTHCEPNGQLIRQQLNANADNALYRSTAR